MDVDIHIDIDKDQTDIKADLSIYVSRFLCVLGLHQHSRGMKNKAGISLRDLLAPWRTIYPMGLISRGNRWRLGTGCGK